MKASRFVLTFTLIGLILILLPISPAQAQAARLSVKITPALSGFSKYGEWLPIAAEIENPGSDVEANLSAQIVSSSTSTTYSVPVSLPSGSRKRVVLYVLPNNYSRQIEVLLTAKDGTLLEKKTVQVSPQPNINYFIGLVAAERGGLALLNGVKFPGIERQKNIMDIAPADLPDRYEGLRSLDLLILNDVDTSRLTPAQTSALQNWVEQGGRLVIGGGAGAAQTLNGLPANLRPVKLLESTEVSAADLPALTAYAQGTSINVSGKFILAKSELISGRILAGTQAVPLLVESLPGKGAVDFVALNLSTSPFTSWPDTIKLWNTLLAPGSAYPENVPEDVSVRQIRSSSMVNALSNIPALDFPSVQGLSILLIVYILLVGPVNYLILRKKKSLHLAWITIPCLTLLFSAGAFGLGYMLKGNDIVLNHVALVSPGANGSAEVSSYVGIFSPAQQAYTAEINTNSLLSPIMDYNGDPWRGGMVQSSSQATFIQDRPARIEGLAVNQWSMQSFASENHWDDFGSIHSDLHLSQNSIAGTIKNDTPQTLKDCTLTFGSSFIRFGDLAPGQSTEVSLTFENNIKELGSPLSYRIYQENINGQRQTRDRLDSVKRNIFSSVFDQGIKFNSGLSGSFKKNLNSRTPSVTLVAWIEQTPLAVSLKGSAISQQTMGMVFTDLPFDYGDSPSLRIPSGIIEGTLMVVPPNGGTCSENGTPGVYIENGSAEFVFQLPTLDGYKVDELSLSLMGDSNAKQSVALYDWKQKSFGPATEAQIGTTNFSGPAPYISSDGQIRLQISKSNNALKTGCIFVNLGLSATKTAQ